MKVSPHNPMQTKESIVAKDVFQSTLLAELNFKLLKIMVETKAKIYEERTHSQFMSDFAEFKQFEESYRAWLERECLLNEAGIINVIKNLIGDINGKENHMYYVIPLSFLDWGINLDCDSELSKFLLSLLNRTDGGSQLRGFTKNENEYPNNIITPSDFISLYTNNWDGFITGNLSYRNFQHNRIRNKEIHF